MYLFMCSLALSLAKAVDMQHDEWSCPPSLENATRPVFTETLTSLVPVCHGRIGLLKCCMSGYTTIRWEQQSKKHTEIWHQFLDEGISSRQILGGKKNQVAVISQVDHTHDEGKYRCIGTDESAGGHELQGIISLKVYDCGSSNRPRLLKPYTSDDKDPKTKYLRLPGQSLDIECQAFYGDVKDCHNRCMMSWHHVDSGGRLHFFNEYEEEKLNKTHPDRVYVVTTELTEHVTRKQTLHIDSVEESDYGAYTCVITSTDTIRVDITLAEGDENPQVHRFKVPLIVTLCLIFIIGSVSLLIGYWYGDEIKLFWKDHTRTRIEGEKKYDLFILYDDDSSLDSDLVQEHLLPKLRTELHYGVCTLPENPNILNHPLFSLYDQANESSRCLVAIISDDLVSNNVLKTCLLDASIAQYRNLTYILYKGGDQCVEQLDEGIQVAYRLANIVRWPGNDSSERDLKKFWVKFQLCLPPKPKHSRSDPEAEPCRAVHPSTSSREPLLARLQDQDSSPRIYSNQESQDSSRGCDSLSLHSVENEFSKLNGVLNARREDSVVSSPSPESPIEDNVFIGNNECGERNRGPHDVQKLGTMVSNDSGRGLSLSL